MNLLLIGPRYSGKTTVGKTLASRLGVPLVDLDDVVLAAFDLPTVEQVWAVEGEPAWRVGEVRALARVLAGDGQVIATGGGVPENEEAAEIIRERQSGGGAFVVYLACPLDQLRARCARDRGDRPALTGHDPTTELEVVLRRREPVYRDLADIVVDASGTASDVATGIAEAMGEPFRSP